MTIRKKAFIMGLIVASVQKSFLWSGRSIWASPPQSWLNTKENKCLTSLIT